MITTIEEARMAFEESKQEIASDLGHAAAENAHFDLVDIIADRCTDKVAAELRRREGLS